MLRIVLRQRIRVKKNVPFVTEIEKAEYNKLMKANHRSNMQFYSDQQGQIENQFIEDFERKEHWLKNFDDKKLRSHIVKKSYKDRNEIEKEKDKQARRKKIVQKYVFDQMSRKTMRKRILDVLDAECAEWVSNPKSKLSVITTDVFSSQSDYFVKLQERANLAITGQFDELEDYTVANQVLDYKNSFLIPLYAKIRNIMRLLRETPMDKLRKEKAIAERALVAYSPDHLKEMEVTYNKLAKLLKKQNEKMETKLKDLEDKLKIIVVLLDHWRKYTFFLLLSTEEVMSFIGFDKFVEEQMSDPVKSQLDYKSSMREIFDGSQEELTDVEEFVSNFDDIEAYVNRKKAQQATSADFKKFLSEFVSEEEIKNIEENFDTLKQKYDSVYGQSKEEKDSDANQFLDEKTLKQIFEKKEDFDLDKPNIDDEIIQVEEANPKTLQSSFFADLMKEKLEELQAQGAPRAKIEAIKELVDKISVIPVEEPQLLQRIFEFEKKFD